MRQGGAVREGGAVSAPGPQMVAPMTPQPVVIDQVTRETHDSFTWQLTPPAGRLEFEAGQFNMIYAFGKGEVPISISGDPRRPERLVHTIRAVGSVTRALAALEPGDVVGVRGPFGVPWPVERAYDRDLLIVAGGVGLAPLRPVIYRAVAERERFRRVLIFYGTRTPRDILFDAELMRWRGQFDLEVEVTVDRGDAAWRGKTGVVTRLLARAELDSERSVAMVCGPEVMMRFVGRELMQQGVTLDRVYVTLERNMQCAVGHCGHCQIGSELICRDGPVYRYDEMLRWLSIREM